MDVSILITAFAVHLLGLAPIFVLFLPGMRKPLVKYGKVW